MQAKVQALEDQVDVLTARLKELEMERAHNTAQLDLLAKCVVYMFLQNFRTRSTPSVIYQRLYGPKVLIKCDAHRRDHFPCPQATTLTLLSMK